MSNRFRWKFITGLGVAILSVAIPAVPAGADPPGEPVTASLAHPDSLADSLPPSLQLPDSLQPPPPDPWLQTPIAELEFAFQDLLCELYPVRASLMGLHVADSTLGPAGEEGRSWMRTRWTEFLGILDTVTDSTLSSDDRFDLALMHHHGMWRLFELDSLRVSERDPRLALDQVSGGIQGLLIRDYAPLEDRVRNLVSRLDQVPEYLAVSYQMLVDPPRILVEQAMARADGLSLFLLNEVPAATADLDSVLTRELTRVSRAAIAAVWRYRELLTTEHLPTASSDFALGPELFAAYLARAEGIETPLVVLRVMAETELKTLKAQFTAVAASLDPTVSPHQTMSLIGNDHPELEEILNTVEAAVNEARLFLETDDSFPHFAPPALEVRATPEPSRLTHASLFIPGPFEASRFPGFIYVTLPDPEADDSEREEHLRFLSRPQLRNLAVHETFPGHCLQAYALREIKRPARVIAWSTAFVEGWAHYAEVTMVERGYRRGDDAYLLVTLQSALRRAGRLRVALGLHTEGWTLDRAAAYLEHHAYLEPLIARREAERGAVDPLYLVYTIGRLELESLRASVQAEEGDAFDLGQFHRRLLALGAPPLPLLRARMLFPDSIGVSFMD